MSYLTVESTKGSTLWTTRMVLVSSHGPTVTATKVLGRADISMGLAVSYKGMSHGSLNGHMANSLFGSIAIPDFL